ncbi:hypothetical protein KEK_10688 [Mycolicibacterium thermoresistibile ATCC 19527]|uniref:Uncharacterized protein n=1 Tax=Mycolicibacterium thermoresistibile (strain ATCC 19527 / DSM 44167 / CIP 105390 / JCM 6362 / NCTC 10409 / 316) TaxID=1078020 RepID=G7CIM6_MYCT3|nr:hypothetical protein KEK_10688 [Mycolicibacterium thermoresistibile ATCC 19527]
MTARNRLSTVAPTVSSRWRASALRASTGTAWLSARSMSSRNGAV